MVPPSSARPRLLDLFCGAGGAAVGYHWAGFDVVGVDNRPQPNYPFEFHQADAMTFPLDGFDAVHASPPCQAYSPGARMRTGTTKDHPRLIEPVRDRLCASGAAYVIENVPEAPLEQPVILCGSHFGLEVRRHRGFEANFPMLVPSCTHLFQPVVVGVYGDHPEDSVIRKGHPAIRARSVEHAQAAMGIKWMTEWTELKEAIPPAYTEHIGYYLLAEVAVRAAA
jgi:DNA (cytosine-5)-methyltransferase 1